MHPLLPARTAGVIPVAGTSPSSQVPLPNGPYLSVPSAAPHAPEQGDNFGRNSNTRGFLANPLTFPVSLPVHAPPIPSNILELPQLRSNMYGFMAPVIPPPSAANADSTTLPAAQRGPTVYVGHLTQDTDDMECGRVVRWSRTTDPATKKLSSFGFCEFESPLGVMRAVRCLNGLILDGQALVANCEDKVKDGLEQWRRDRKNKLQEENPSKSIQEIDADIEREELRIQNVTQKIAADWNARVAANKVCPPPAPSDEVPPTPEAPLENQREAQRQKWFDSLPGYVDVPPTVSLSSRAATRIRIWNNRLKENRTEFRKRMQAWQRKESYLARERKKRREETDELVRSPASVTSTHQRKRLIELDRKDLVYYLSLDGGVWEGELSSRRQHERAERLESEKKWDQEDVVTEQREAAEEAERLERQQRKEKEEQERLEEEERQRRLEEQVAENEKKRQQAEVRNMARRAAEVAARREQQLALEAELAARDAEASAAAAAAAAAALSPTSISGPIKISLTMVAPKKQEPATAPSEAATLFLRAEDEDDDDAGHRKHAPLVKLDAPLHRDNRNITESLTQEIVLKIAAQVPKENEDLFAYRLDWHRLNTRNIFALKVTPWINKKVVEFLGEEEPQLVRFIVEKLGLEVEPRELIEELKEFLDEDAEGFIVKLWKLLVFEDLRLKQESSSSST